MSGYGYAVLVTDDEAAAAPREYWYRYDDVAYAAPVDEYGNPRGVGRIEVRLSEFLVLKVTLHGVWLDYITGTAKGRFVLRTANKRFACPTKEEALVSYIARKNRQIAILTAQLRRANRGRAIAVAMQHPEADAALKAL